MNNKFVLGGIAAGLASMSGIAPARAFVLLDSFLGASAIGLTNNSLIASASAGPVGIPLFTSSTYSQPFQITSFDLSVTKNSSALAQLNSNYNLQASLYSFTTSSAVTTTSTGLSRSLLLDPASGVLVAQNTFTLPSSSLSFTSPSPASPLSRTFSASTPGQSVGLASIFNTNFAPETYYLLQFSNPSAADTGPNGAETGNATYNLRLTGSSNSIRNTTPDPRLRWNDAAIPPCSSTAQTTLAGGQSCRYGMNAYRTTGIAFPNNELWINIQAENSGSVPAPLPILGGCIAFTTSRNIRKRLKSAAITQA